jgi:hypothetical protein
VLSFFDPDNNPVSDAFFGQICRETPEGARDLAFDLPGMQRARLALFCNARSHSRENGRAIASTCDSATLIRVGALAGRILSEQVTAGPALWSVKGSPSHKRISLATHLDDTLFDS